MRQTLELSDNPRPLVAPMLRMMLVWALLGVLAIVAAYQLPARHIVAIGLNDAAYVQGFSDPANRWGVIDAAFATREPFRRSTADAALIFPQLGLPAEATLSWRAAADTPVRVRVLQGADELASVEVGASWSEQRLAIHGGIWKPNDVVLRLEAEPADGLLLRRAELRSSAWPVLPYPAQLAYGGLAVALAAVLLPRRAWRLAFAGGLAGLFMLLYRVQLSPFPVRSLLPGTVIVLAILLAIRALPRIERTGVWASAATAVLLAGWLGWLALQAGAHVVLSLPGVERDFAVFVSRATALVCPGGADRDVAPCVLRADGFYQLGYPFILWAVTQATAEPFVAARGIAIIAGGVLLLAVWSLGRRLYGAPGALLALAIAALSSVTVQYSLTLGTDMPFAALWTAALAALLVPRRHSAAKAALAGVLCGLAFLVRHPGLVLLPFGVVALAILSRRQAGGVGVFQGIDDVRPKHSLDNLHRLGAGAANASALQFSIPFVLAWLLATSPQLIINVADTGNPLYNQQAKNIWLAVYGDIDYSRWSEASDDIGLGDLVVADPARFFANWGRNLKAFIATGAEDTSEFGRGIGLRLLGFPANLLAFAGVVLWLWRGGVRERLLLLAGALYVLGVSVGFALPRFYMPLLPIFALAAVAPLGLLGSGLARRLRRLSLRQWSALLALALLGCLASGPRIGAQYVLERQNAAAVAIVAAVRQRLAPGSGVQFVLNSDDLLDDTSAIAGLADIEPASILVLGEDQPLPARLASRAPFAAAGPYRAYKLP